MALTFIPEIWSAIMLDNLHKSLVYAGPTVVNRDYEGEVRNQGDTVRIRNITRPTISDYVKNTTVINPQTLTDVERSLLIDQAKYFAFEVDDIDAAQTPGGEMDAATMEASYGLADTADQFVAGLYTEVDAGNQLGTVAVTTPALAVDTLVDLRVKLDEADVPTQGRYAVVPAWYHGLLLGDDRFVRVDASGSTEGLRNGTVGRAFGFDVLMSNNAPNPAGDDNVVMAGYPGAIAFADQIVSVETYRPESAFSDAVKGLHVYGAKVTRPTGLATAVASQT